MKSLQDEGIIGKLVGQMIQRTVRKCFHSIYWVPPAPLSDGPKIFACSHHGWHDGYLMYHVVSKLQKQSLDWITEFDAFPLFKKVGGMPFPRDKPEVRASTIRKTIHLMQSEKRSLILFPEVELHHGPEIRPLGRAVTTVARHTKANVIPIAIRYRMALHERPEAFITLGDELDHSSVETSLLRDKMQELIDETWAEQEQQKEWQILVQGTLDVNERWDFRAKRGRK